MIKAKKHIKRGVTARLIPAWKEKEKKTPHRHIVTQEEIDICLNCPFPECIHRGACDYFKEEQGKIKAARQRRKK